MGTRLSGIINRVKKADSEANQRIFDLSDQKTLIGIRQKRGLYEKRWNVSKEKWEYQKIDQKDIEHYFKIKNLSEKNMLEESEKEFEEETKKYCWCWKIGKEIFDEGMDETISKKH